LRESSLLREVQRLRSGQNGFRATSPESKERSTTSDLQSKCRKLEDALLSLQDENIKLNRFTQDAPYHILYINRKRSLSDAIN